MFVKRLFPTRWAKILAWIGAGLAWGSVAVAANVRAQSVEASPPEPVWDPVEPATTTTMPSVLPAQPADGLVVIRYAPVAPPAPEVIVRTVAGPARQTSSTPKVKSSGS